MADTDPSEWRLLDTDLTTQLTVLPASKSHLYFVLNEPGSGELSIPLNSTSAGLVSSGKFAQANYRGSSREGFFTENIKKVHADAGEGGGEWLSMSGRGAMALLEDTIIFDTGDGTVSTRTFTSVPKGSILKTLIDEAQARGGLAALTYDFSATLDSDGEAWADSENYELNVGTSLLEIVRQFAKTGIDFEVVYSAGTFVLSAYKLGIGTDKSETIFFRVGTNCEEVDSDERGDDIVNVYRVAYKSGSLTLTDPTSIAARRRREKLLSVKQAQSAASATTYGAAILDSTKDPKRGISVKIYDGVGPRVFVDYEVGDTITLDIKGVETTYRVLGIQCDWDGKDYSEVVVELNNLLYENELHMAQDIDFLLNQWNTAHDGNLLEVTYWATIGTWETLLTTIQCMTIIGDTLYAGGNKGSGGEQVFEFASYNILTGVWTGIGMGSQMGNVFCMQAIGTDLYIGGAGGSSGGCIAKFDTLTSTLTYLDVTAIDTGIDFSLCYALEAIGTDLYATGFFDDADGTPVFNILKYDTVGLTFDAMAGGFDGLGTKIGRALAAIGSTLYIGGTVAQAGGVPITNVASWNGTTYADLDGGLDNTVYALKAYGTNILAGGDFTDGISEWDGVGWTILGSGTSGIVYAIDTYLTDVYIAGDFTDLGNYIAKYSGGAYFTLVEGLNGIGRAIAIDDTDVYVGGDFTTAGTKPVNLMAVYFNNFESILDYIDTANGFDLGQAIHNATAAAITDAGEIPFWDSITRKLRKITWANIKATLKTYFDTLYMDLLTDQTAAGVKTFSDRINVGVIPPVDGGDGSVNQAAEGLSAGDVAWTWGVGFTSFFTGLFARGTKASPTTVLDDDPLVKLRGRGYDGAGYGSTSGEVRVVADEDFDGSGHGTRIELYTTPNNSTTLTKALTIRSDQFLDSIHLDSIGSSGFYNGGEITDSGLGEIDIAAGFGFIRATSNELNPLLPISWGAFTNVAIPDDTVRYIYIDYNGGSPTYSLSADEFAEAPDKILIGVAIDEGGSIDSVFNVGVRLAESIGNAGRFMRNVFGISRDTRRGGLLFGLSGTLKITVSPGSLWWGRTRYPITELDTNVAGSFSRYYYNGAAWVKVATQTDWPQTQYNDIASGLVTMTNDNRWANLWWYIEPDDHVVMVYGRAEYTSQSNAELESPPSTLPNRLQVSGVLAARFTFQKNSGTASISSAFDTTFTPVVVSSPDASQVTYTPLVAADWDGAADPGDVDNALDQLAERTTDLEGAPSAGDMFKTVYDPDLNLAPAYVHVGAAAPADLYSGRLWYDTNETEMSMLVPILY